MRKLKKIGLLLLFSALIFGCDFTVNQPNDSEDITTIKGSELGSGAWYFKSYDLSEYASQTVKIELSCKIKTSSSNKIHLMWQINQAPEYPTIAQADVGSDWVELKGTKEVSIEAGNQLYLSNYQIDFSNLTIYIKDFSYKVTNNRENWLSDSTPSLKETYKDIFDSFGLACEYGNFGTWGGNS